MVRMTGLAIISAAALFSGCATSGGSGIQASAERLERSALNLNEDAREVDLSSDLREDTRAFADEARDFRRVIEEGDNDEDDVRDAYRKLSERYHALRDEVGEENSRAAELEFDDVTEAYLDIERAMRRYRVASGD